MKQKKEKKDQRKNKEDVEEDGQSEEDEEEITKTKGRRRRRRKKQEKKEEQIRRSFARSLLNVSAPRPSCPPDRVEKEHVICFFFLFFVFSFVFLSGAPLMVECNLSMSRFRAPWAVKTCYHHSASENCTRSKREQIRIFSLGPTELPVTGKKDKNIR